jgi:gluconolactonase
MSDMRTITDGLRFPEGPVAMADGSVVLTEIAAGRITRVSADGTTTVVAEPGGGPNGAAIGPDGALYVTNNGAYFDFAEVEGLGLVPSGTDRQRGSIQRIDLDSGAVQTIYTECDGRQLVAPNDLVFDGHGGFWFTDHGVDPERYPEHPGVLYARADGSHIVGAAFGTHDTNGVGLSPDGTRLYVAETGAGLVWEWEVVEPGVLAPLDERTRTRGRLLHDAAEGLLFDSLAVDGGGWVCVATIGMGVPGGITAIAPDGSSTEFHPSPDFLTTNVCFGGDDGRTAYVTCSSQGLLVSATWPRPGLGLAHQA